MRRLLFIMFSFTASVAWAQSPARVNYGSFTGAIGSGQGSAALEYFHNWQLGQSKKFEIGIGGRLTSYFGSDQYFSSAPASLAGDETKTDSLLMASAQMNAVNLAINLGYRFSPKFGVGFNIDALGFTFGGRKEGRYLNGNQGQLVQGKPTSFNVLLIGNNDRGTLNSEFYARYFFNERWGIKLAYQYLFTEYTTDVAVQQQPEANDRFRNKASMVSIGVTKVF
ncbi:MAG TPA: hypothetical protein DCE81_12600 [Cytophagales bacterium]|nr:hypothetical protein [Cytophagales bacterium]